MANRHSARALALREMMVKAIMEDEDVLDHLQDAIDAAHESAALNENAGVTDFHFEVYMRIDADDFVDCSVHWGWL